MDANTALDELQFIKKIIQDNKITVLSNGIEFIVWGVLVVIGLLLNYITLTLKIELDFGFVWIIVISVGWLFSFYSAVKRKRSAYVKTFARKILGSVWLSVGLTMTLLGFVGTYSGAFRLVFVSPILASLLGVAFFITGVLQEQTWIKWLCIGWWTGAVIMFLYPGIQTILIMASMMLLFQVIPGIYIYKKYQLEFKIKS